MKTFLFAASSIPLILAACAGHDDALADVESLPADIDPRADADETPPDPIELVRGGRQLSQGSLYPELVSRLSQLSSSALRASASVDRDPNIDLAWRDCGTTGTRAVQCAELQVPLDGDGPDARVISVELDRMLAPSDVLRRGELLYDPCGPSGTPSARDIAAAGGFESVAPGFDIVTFDPDGLGDGSTLECELVAAVLSDPTSDAPADRAQPQERHTRSPSID